LANALTSTAITVELTSGRQSILDSSYVRAGYLDHGFP
jgi:hypothetical protein